MRHKKMKKQNVPPLYAKEAMAEEHQCPRCGYTTVRSDSMTQHLYRKVPCEPTLSNESIDSLKQGWGRAPGGYRCEPCKIDFPSRMEKSRHAKNCKAKMRSDMRDLRKQMTDMKVEVKKLEKEAEVHAAIIEEGKRAAVVQAKPVKYIRQKIPHSMKLKLWQDRLGNVPLRFPRVAPMT